MKMVTQGDISGTDWDVKKYFPDSEAVNKALRSLIEIIPSKRRITAHIK